MYLDTDFPPGVRLAQFMRVASDLDQVEIGVAIDTLIARLDAAAGDPDIEDGGDDEPSGDERDASFPEWQPRGRRSPTFAFGTDAALNHEDAEEDDHAEQDDEPEDDGEDRCYAGDDHMIAGPVYNRNLWERDTWAIGDDADAERSRQRPTWAPAPADNDTVPA